MKSLLNLSTQDTTQPGPSAWMPGDFYHTPEKNVANIDATQQIFQTNMDATIPAAGRNGLTKAFPDLLVSGWQPGELKYQQFIPAKVVKRNPNFDRSTSGSLLEDKLAAHSSKVTEESFILADAQLKAADILTRAVSSVEETSQKAYLEGLERGKAELTSTLDAANNLIGQLHSMEQEILVNSETQVLDLVKEIARSMFGEGVVLDGKALHETFSHALANARSLGNLKVYLNPKDALNIDPNWREDQVYISGQKMQFIPSEDIKPGGCYVIGEQGSVDARIDTKLASILKVLTRYEDKS